MRRPRLPDEQFSAAQCGALLDDDGTMLPGFRMHQTPVLEQADANHEKLIQAQQIAKLANPNPNKAAV
jgi:hypothetical protein